MEDSTGNTVSIKQLIGSYSLVDLERQKTQLNNQIAVVQEKIDAINNI
jgi:hypothetical protein